MLHVWSCRINSAFDDVSIRQNSLQLCAWPDGALPLPPNEPSWRSGPGCFRSGPFPSLATEVGASLCAKPTIGKPRTVSFIRIHQAGSKLPRAKTLAPNCDDHRMISLTQNRRIISVRQHHRMTGTNARIGMKKCILVVAQQIELRARIARVLQSAGYAVELAESQKRALELATGGQIETAIVVPSTDLAGLERELRDWVPRTIVLGHRTDEVMRQDHSVRGGDALSAQDALSAPAFDEQKLLDQLGYR